MEVIFAAAVALARGDMCAVVGMWSSGQAGLALQRGEARGRKGREEDVAKRAVAAAAAPPARTPARPTASDPRGRKTKTRLLNSLSLSFLSTSKTIFMAINSATAAAMDFHIHEKKTGPSQTSLFEFVLRRGSGT